MQLTVPPGLETPINKRLSSGGYQSPEDVLRRALEAQDAAESWTDEERRALSAHIEEGYLQAERGELIGGAQARREIQGMKDNWREAGANPVSEIRIKARAGDRSGELPSSPSDPVGQE